MMYRWGILICSGLLASGCGGGGGAAPLSAPSQLSYSNPVNASVGAAIVPLNPSVEGTVTSYAVSPALPPGLVLDRTSGTISGTPTALAADAHYDISAGNSAGKVDFELELEVGPMLPPSALFYANPLRATVGVAITLQIPSVLGAVTSYSVAPALPAGLSLDPDSGVLAGTASVAAAQAPYVITATGPAGSTSANFVLGVDPAAGETATGVFRDSTVSGLGYSSGAHRGITNANGQFVYELGQGITFNVGAVVLGSVPLAKALITPTDLPDGSSSGSYTLNVVRFLLMLDQDGDPSNGITISAAVTAAAASWPQVDFTTTDLATALAAIVQQATTADGGTHNLPAAATAQTHLFDSTYCAYSGGFVGTFSGDTTADAFGLFVAAVEPDGGITLFEQSISTVNTIRVESALSAGSLALDGTFQAATKLGAVITGSFLDPDYLFGSYQPDEADGGVPFRAARIGGAPSATYRFTGSYAEDNNPSGIVVLDVDAEDKVSGIEYRLYSPYPQTANLQIPVSGTISGSTFSGMVGSTAVIGTFASDTLTLTVGSSTDPHSFIAHGCRLN